MQEQVGVAVEILQEMQRVVDLNPPSQLFSATLSDFFVIFFSWEGKKSSYMVTGQVEPNLTRSTFNTG